METKPKNEVATKLLKIDDFTHEVYRRDAIRQSSKPNTVICMKDIARQNAERLNKKYKYIKDAQ